MGTVKYDTQAVFVGPAFPTGNLTTGDITQISRVQATSYSIELERENVLGLGSANANDQIKNAPIVNLSFDYLVTNGENEKRLGFTVDGHHGTMLGLNSGERDFFLLINKPNETPMVLAIGNGMLAKYSVQGQLNSFLKASAEVRGFNIQLDAGTSGNFGPRVDIDGVPERTYTYALPAVTEEIRDREEGQIEDNIYVGPQHLDVHFPNNSAFGMIMSGENKSYLQSFNFSLGLDRTEATQLGEKYPFKRCLQLPTSLTLSATLLLSNFVADNIQNYFCQKEYDIEIDIKNNKCSNTDEFWETEYNSTKLKYMFKGMKLKNFSSSDSIGDRKAVNLEWSVPIGNLLDVNKNFLMSGDFGRYLFPVDSFRDVSGEQSVTGQNLQPFVKEIVYKRSKVDVEVPEFSFEMKGQFDTLSGDLPYLVFYQGDSGFLPYAQNLNPEIIEENFFWRADGYSTVFDGIPTSGYSQKFSTLVPRYNVGSPTLFDTHTGQYYFYFKGYGFNTEPVQINFAGLPTWIDPYIEEASFSIDPYKPYYFNKLGLTVNAFDVPTGQSFDFQLQARNSKFQKIYNFSAQTPYSFHVALPESLSKKTSLFLQPYDETEVSRTATNEIISVSDSSPRNFTFSGVTGSGYLPGYSYKSLNDKSFATFETGAYLRYTVASGVSGWSGLRQDFTNFSFFAVYRPRSTSESDAPILKFSSQISGNQNAAFFGRKALSEDFEYYYTSVGGSQSTHINLVSSFAYDAWNMVSVISDGRRASGYRGGNFIQGTNFTGATSGTNGTFTHIDIATNDFHGDVAEIILFPYTLFQSEIDNVHNYLKYKWGF